MIAYVLALFMLLIYAIFGQDDDPRAAQPRAGGRPETLIFRSTNVPIEYARESLPGWTVTDTLQRRADAVYADGFALQDNKLYAIRATLKCRLDAKILFDKTRLSEILMDASPETVCRSYVIKRGYVLEPGTWIIKSNWGWAGKGNIIVNTQSELDRAIEVLTTGDNIPAFQRRDDIRLIASEYITDPMLYHGRKFHVRIFGMILVPESGSPAIWVMNDGLIAPAKLPYEAADWDNADIHDSHFSKCPELNGQYPRDLGTDPAPVMELFKKVFTAVGPRLKKYPEGKNAYDIFAADVMFLADGTPRLLEFNKFPGMLNGDEFKVSKYLNSDEWRYKIFSAWLGSVFSTVFGGEHAGHGGYGDPTLTTRVI